MTNREALKILRARVECMICEKYRPIYKNCDECELCYARGTFKQQIEAVEVVTKAVEAVIKATGDGGEE